MKDVYDPHSGLVYEVNIDVDAAIEGPFDTWLRDHIADLLALPGFQTAEILEDRSLQPGRIRRTVQYRLQNQTALDNYQQVHAPRLRAQAIERFGDRFHMERRTLAHREEFVSGAVSTENCLNCGEVLTGQHCAHCGQRARVRVISLWALLKDVVGDILEWDSRVWRTLRPLAFKPGWLTQQFLQGRRASFTPPFRMYLFLSVAFFVIASLDDPGKDIGFRNDSEGTGLVIGPQEPAAATKEADKATSPAPAVESAGAKSPTTAEPTATDAPSVARPLDPETNRLIEAVIKRAPESEREKLRTELERGLAEVPDGERKAVSGIISDPCSEKNFRVDIFGSNPYEDRLRQACTKITTDTATFGRALWSNIPKMMFIFLPLIAAVMGVLYVGSRRYYVEHLVFFVHYHAFFFLAGIVLLIIERIGDPDGGPLVQAFDRLASVLEFVLVFYVPWYLFRAMRRVYGQGRIVTLLKFLVLNVAYIFCIVLTAVGLLFYTALTL